jgi:RHS repeat-associated protein
VRDELHALVYEPSLNDFGLLSGVNSSATVAGGTLFRSWSSAYQNDVDQWLIGVPLDRRETERTASGEETIRFTMFSPEPGRGVPRFVDIEPLGGIDESLRLEYIRNSFGQVTALRRMDKAGAIRQELVTYDEQSVHPRTHTNGVGHVTTVVADPATGRPRTVTDPNNIRTTLSYDFFGMLRRVDYPGGFGKTITYTREPEPNSTPGEGRDVWRITTVFDGGGESRQFINRLGQEIRQERKNLDGGFSFESRAYDDLGLPAQLTRFARVGSAAGPATTWLYDELGRPTSQSRPEDGVDAGGVPASTATTSFVHDGLTSTITDDFGRLRRISLDEAGRVRRSEARNDAGQWLPADFTYGPFDVLRFVARRNGTGLAIQTTEARFDVRGRRVSLTDPDAGTRTFRYNAFGDVREEVDATGSVTTYLRDAEGRLEERRDKDGLTTFTWDTAANGRGQIAETLSASGVRRRYSYDPAGRLSREVWTIRGTAYQIDYAYEAQGRLSKVSYPNVTGFSRFVARNSYDSDSGDLSRVQNDATDKVLWELNATEADGQVVQESFGNGIRTEYGYSSRTGRIGTIKSTVPRANTTVRSWSYGYWVDGNLQRRSDLLAGEHERFEYDGIERIKRWMAADSAGNPLSGGWVVNYTLDDFGNLTRRQFVAGSSTGGVSQDLSFGIFPGTNRVQSSPWGTYSYDAGGNQVGRPDGETIAYTAFDLPRSIGGPRAADFLYDALGVRAEKRKSSSDFTVYVGGIYERRRSSAGTDHVFYVNTGGRALLQVMRREGGSESTSYVHRDRLGSVDAVTDSAGTVIERSKFDPYGNRVANFNEPALPTSVVAPTNKVKLGFTGHEGDDELGLVNMRGRVYDPRLARFLTPDPLVSRGLLGQAYNRYAYVLNNPLRFTDPSGFSADGCDAEDPYRLPDGSCVRTPPAGSVCLDYVCGWGEPTPAIPEPSSPPEPPTPPPGGGLGGGGPSPPPPPPPAPPPDPNPPTGNEGNGMTMGTTMVMPRPMAPPVPVAPPQPGTISRALGAAASWLARGVTAIGAGLAAFVSVTLYSPELNRGEREALQTRPPNVLQQEGGGPKIGSEGGPGAGKPFSESTKDAVRTGECVFCGTPTTRQPGPDQANIDHAIPKSRGGNNTVDNAQETCRTCNQEKRTQTTEEYLQGR